MLIYSTLASAAFQSGLPAIVPPLQAKLVPIRALATLVADVYIAVLCTRSKPRFLPYTERFPTIDAGDSRVQIDKKHLPLRILPLLVQAEVILLDSVALVALHFRVYRSRSRFLVI